MTRVTKEIVIGALATFLFAIGFAGASVQNNSSTFSSDGFYRVNAIYNHVDGLYPGDQVRMSGIPIGTIEEQRLDQNYRAIMTFAIRDDVKLPLDTSAAIHTNGLFGSKFVPLEPGGDFDYLVNGDEIQFTQDSVVVEDLLELIISQGKAKLQSEN